MKNFSNHDKIEASLLGEPVIVIKNRTTGVYNGFLKNHPGLIAQKHSWTELAKDLKKLINYKNRTTMEVQDLVNKLRNFRQTCYDMKIAVSDIDASSRELSLAYTSFEKAQMWCGNAIGYIPNGPEYPYPESVDPSTGDAIAPLHDIDHKSGEAGTEHSIVVIKALRKGTKDALEDFWTDYNNYCKNISLSSIESDDGFMMAKTCTGEVWKNFQEGINWLGVELGRIRDERNG